jgi:hypothetical protein
MEECQKGGNVNILDKGISEVHYSNLLAASPKASSSSSSGIVSGG